MSIIEFEIKNPRKKLEFYEQLHKENITRIEKLRKENQQLKLDYELYKDNHIYKNYEVETKDNTIKQLKEVIKEVKEHIEETCYYPEEKNYSSMTINEVKELLQILNKVGD